MKRLLPVAVALLLSAGAAALLYRGIAQPYAGFRQPVFVMLERGAPARAIARDLAAGGVIRGPWAFLAVRLLRPRVVLQAGEYRFDRPASTWEVFDRIVRGDVYFHVLAIPEGSNIFDVARLAARLGWLDSGGVLEAARDPSPIRDLAPQAATLEGYLFPATYYVTRNTSARALCGMMTSQFRRVWRRLGSRAPAHETVTLASLVEKETAVAAERPLVASVYRNRLDRGMKLDCDPTAIYAALLEGRYDGRIRSEDLASPNPYNTYRRPGLPPGPIANPGEASLRAALDPARTPFLYFVALPDGSGAHQFSVSLEAHNRAVARYRRAARRMQREKPARGVSPPAGAGSAH